MTKFQPFASDREKRLAWFAQEILDCATDGFDADNETIINLAERAGLVFWDTCRQDNEDEWPECCEHGDMMWRLKRDQLPAGVIKLETT